MLFIEEARNVVQTNDLFNFSLFNISERLINSQQEWDKISHGVKHFIHKMNEENERLNEVDLIFGI